MAGQKGAGGSSHRTHTTKRGRAPWRGCTELTTRRKNSAGRREGLALARKGSGVRLHVLLQLPEPLNKLLRLLVGATLQHPKRRPHCGRGRCQSSWPRPRRSVTLDSARGGANIGPAGPALPGAHSPWARGRRRCSVTGWPALALPPTWGLATPPPLPRPRAVSPAKSLVDSQSWSMTVNSTQAPRRRQASAGTELHGGRGEAGGYLEPCSPLRVGRAGRDTHK